MRALEKAKKVIDSNLTPYKIGKASGISNSVIFRLRSGERDLGKISASTLDKLERFYDEEFGHEQHQKKQ